jgi:uncharacterized membrane protein
MSQTPLTQEMIDTPGENGTEKRGVYATASKHPLVTGGLVLAGAGLAYAVGRLVTASHDDQIAREVHVETSITIDKPPEELYEFWRDLKNLPLFMRNLESVTELGEGKSHWVASGIGGGHVEWDAEIYHEVPNETIAWRTLENADVINAGAVNFRKVPGGRGTHVSVTMNYNPPAGRIGATVAQLLGVEPRQLIREDLRRLKQYLETGELATIAGQTSGRAASEGDDNAMESNITNQQSGEPQDEQFEKAKTGAVAVTGNVEQGPPQPQSSPRDEGKTSEAEPQAGPRGSRAATHAA